MRGLGDGDGELGINQWNGAYTESTRLGLPPSGHSWPCCIDKAQIQVFEKVPQDLGRTLLVSHKDFDLICNCPSCKPPFCDLTPKFSVSSESEALSCSTAVA